MTPTSRKPALGTAALLGAALFWGVGFYAQRLSIEHMGPLWATSLRFLMVVPLAVASGVWRQRRGHRLPWRAGAILGVILYASFTLQTVAIKYTPLTRVALITGLYAVFVPLIQPLFGLRRANALQLGAAALATVGMVLLCGIVGDAQALAVPANLGDALTLVMALLSAVYVLLVGVLAKDEDPIATNAVQLVVMAALSLVFALVLEGGPPATVDPTTLASLVYLGFFSTFAAFALQFIGQQHVSPATAGVLMLQETPIGVLSAVVIVGEAMAAAQWLGALVAFVAVGVAVYAEHR